MKILKLLNLTIILLLLLAIFAYLYLYISISTMIKSEMEIIEEIYIKEKDYEIMICYIPSNATKESYIQVRIKKDGIEKVILNEKKFNFVDKYSLIDNDTLLISISDTLRKSKIKDVKVKLP